MRIRPIHALPPLDTIEPVPVTEFPDIYGWGEHVCAMPQYCFGVCVQDGRIALSHEHTEFKWLKCGKACHQVRYDGSRIA